LRAAHGDDFGTRFGEMVRAGPTNAFSRASDDHRFTGELHGTPWQLNFP
jgi:hypothetical protein